jgi:ADP-ribose pyrophosphatase
MSQTPRLTETTRTRLSAYVTLVERHVDIDGRDERFHAFEQADYVNVLAVTADDRVALVSQYRPVVDRVTVELPGGHRDPGEVPEATARRELYEEAGLRPGILRALGRLSPDPGRLTNTFWGFVALDCERDPNWTAEAETSLTLTPLSAFHAMALDGRIDNAPHIALYGLAVLNGWLQPPKWDKSLSRDLRSEWDTDV